MRSVLVKLKSTNLKKSATVVFLVISGMIAGLLVEMSIARELAASEPVQIYRMSFSLPLLLALTVSGALVNTAVAEMSKSHRVSEEIYQATVRLISRIFVIGACTLAGLGIATVSLQQQILAPGLADDATGKFVSAARLGWLMFFFISAPTYIRAQINLNGIVWLNPSISLQRNLGFLLVFVIFQTATPSDQVLPISALAASVVVLSIHLIAGRYYQVSWGAGGASIPELGKKHRDYIIKALTITMVFQLLSTSTTLADRAALSLWDLGAVPHFDYSVTVITAFGALFANVNSILILPMLLAESDTGSTRATNVRPFLIVFCGAALCVSIVLALGRLQIVALLFERGAFTESDTIATAQFLLWHAAGMFFLIINSVYFIVFLARGNIQRLLPIAALRWAIRIALLMLPPVDLTPAQHIGLAFLITEATIFLIFLSLRVTNQAS